jgi:hypothetical protein
MENTMGKIILCRGKKADTPLTVLQTGVKLYTAEELCYYIYNNIYLIGQDFIDDNLISFLDETGEKELAERVRKLKETGGSLAQIFVIILKTIDYYSVAEIEQLKKQLTDALKQPIQITPDYAAGILEETKHTGLIVQNWHTAWKWVSTWAFGLIAYVSVAGIPPEVLALVPEASQSKVTAALALLGFVGRFINQSRGK